MSASKLIKSSLSVLAVCLAMLIGLPILGVCLIALFGNVHTLHLTGWITWVGPSLLAMLTAAVITIWWRWEPIIISRRFNPEVQQAWLEARNRIALWGFAWCALMCFLLINRN